MATASELVRAFASAWKAHADIGVDIEERLVALCELAHRELGARDLDDAIDDVQLVTALATHAPDEGVVAYLDVCHPTELAIAQAACRGHAAAIAMIERDHHATIEALCWRYASPSYTAADLRQVLREKLYVGSQPKLAEYSGRGRLDSWLRVTAVRTFLDLNKRKDRAREAQADDDELAMPGPDDLSLEIIKAEYRAAVRDAFHAAAAELDLADRHLLHQHFVAGLSIDQLGVALGIHRATAARRVERAREALVAGTRALLASRLQLPTEELDEVIGMVLSRLDVSIPRLLQPRPDDAGR